MMQTDELPPLSAEELTELGWLAEEATRVGPSEWVHDGDEYVYHSGPGGTLVGRMDNVPDAAYIAAAKPQTLRRLLAMVERGERERAVTEAAVERDEWEGAVEVLLELNVIGCPAARGDCLHPELERKEAWYRICADRDGKGYPHRGRNCWREYALAEARVRLARQGQDAQEVTG